MDYEHIHVEIKEEYALVTIDRPKALNALSSAVLSELTQATSEIELIDEVRVVILTGAGDKAFVAGADIAEMRELAPRQAEALAEMGGILAATIETSSKPYIAAVNGFALGGGLRAGAGLRLHLCLTTRPGSASPRSSSASFRASAAPSACRAGSAWPRPRR